MERKSPQPPEPVLTAEPNVCWFESRQEPPSLKLVYQRGPSDLKGEFGVPPSPIRSGFQVRLTNRRDGQLASQLNREVPTQSPQNSPEWPFLGRRRLRKRSPGKTVAVC